MNPAHPDMADARLPNSHYFITLARGSASRTLRVRTGLLRIAAGGVAILGCWTLCSSLYLAFHDDLMASVMAREAQQQYAYEDRIAALRNQVNREASLHLVGQSTLEGQIAALTHRADALETRAALVAQLAERAGLARPSDRAVTPMAVNAAPSLDEAVDNPPGPSLSPPSHRDIPPASALPSWRDKPHPEADLTSFTNGRHAERDEGASIHLRMAALTESLEHTDAAQYSELARIGATARKKVDMLRAALDEAGLRPERFHVTAAEDAEGGPFVPLPGDISASPFGRALDSLQNDVAAEERLRGVIPKVPLASPLLGRAEVTSPFGPRIDPFLGRAAMHTGVDLREPFGTEVRATAGGKVVNAGPAGGYGNMIEIDHGNGLATRYGHLSSILVSVGQQVTKGEVIGEVGATGRATGPHLHYETRIDGEAVDPMHFLQAGQRLAAIEPLR